MGRVLIVGLDGFEPALAERWRDDLPNLTAITEAGIHGPLESVVQPITPPAWTSMLTGRNPGHFGFTDFTYRVASSYTDVRLVNSTLVRIPTLYSAVADAGGHAMAVGVPVGYPPVQIPNGVSVSCFMAPSVERGITHPPEIQAELLAATTSPFVLDVTVPEGAEPGQVDREALVDRAVEMDRQRFDIAGHLMRTRPWDLMFVHCLGTDRVAHHFMRYADPEHRRHDPDPRFADAVLRVYRAADRGLGELADLAGPDATVLVVSDHGAQRLDGKVNLNDWLARHGYLTLSEPVDSPTPLSKAPVDWGRTRAWSRGWGGQVYLNVRGREPDGVVAPEDAEDLLAELEARLANELTDPEGQALPAEVIRREHVYDGPHAETCPDLFLQIDGYRHLTSDLVGHDRATTPVEDLAFEDASHTRFGILAMAGSDVSRLGRFSALHVLDVAPTVLDLLGLPLPADLEGRPVHRVEDVFSPQDEAELTSRLRTLYLE